MGMIPIQIYTHDFFESDHLVPRDLYLYYYRVFIGSQNFQLLENSELELDADENWHIYLSFETAENRKLSIFVNSGHPISDTASVELSVSDLSNGMLNAIGGAFAKYHNIEIDCRISAQASGFSAVHLYKAENGLKTVMSDNKNGNDELCKVTPRSQETAFTINSTSLPVTMVSYQNRSEVDATIKIFSKQLGGACLLEQYYVGGGDGCDLHLLFKRENQIIAVVGNSHFGGPILLGGKANVYSFASEPSLLDVEKIKQQENSLIL